MREILRALREGQDIGITVDGPRGPAYEAKPGIGLLAKLSGAPIVYVVPEIGRGWRAKSWDRFCVPRSVHFGLKVRIDIQTGCVPNDGRTFLTKRVHWKSGNASVRFNGRNRSGHGHLSATIKTGRTNPKD